MRTRSITVYVVLSILLLGANVFAQNGQIAPNLLLSESQFRYQYQMEEDFTLPVIDYFLYPSVQAVKAQYQLENQEIILVQEIIFLCDDQNDDSWQIVLTSVGEFWYHIIDQVVITDISTVIAGSRSARIRGSGCVPSAQHPQILFYLPTCFREISPGRFDGIIDAWASSVIPGLRAWDGPGYENWWNYHTCSGSRSQIVGKQVQTRWFWANFSCLNYLICYLVEALITW